MSLAIDERIRQSTAKHAKEIQNREIINREFETKRREREKCKEIAHMKELTQIKSNYTRKFYDDLLEIVSVDNLVEVIGKAKAEGKKYAMLYNVSTGTHLTEREKLLYTFNPCEIGTIYEILRNKLTKFPGKYEINIEEPWGLMTYNFKLYISWADMSICDKFIMNDGYTKENHLWKEINEYYDRQRSEVYEYQLRQLCSRTF